MKTINIRCILAACVAISQSACGTTTATSTQSHSSVATPAVAHAPAAPVHTSNSSSAVTATSATNFSKTGTYRITTVIKKNAIQLGSGSTLIFDGGTISGARITGSNIRIVVNNSKLCFDNCTFSGSIVNSQIKASQFGCVPNMSQSTQSGWSVKGLRKQTITLHNGTDNFKAIERLGTFLNNSNGVDLEWDGAFFSAHQKTAKNFDPPKLKLTGCKNLTMHGGTLIHGILFSNCENVEIHSMSFKGYHLPHDFPPIHPSGAPSKAVKQNGVTYTKTMGGKLAWADNCYYYGSDGTSMMGLASEALVFNATAGQQSTGINVHDCHFEMRLNGVVFGDKDATGSYASKGTVKNCTLRNCTFSHFIFQPIGMHATQVLVEDVSGDYALQPIDMSSVTHNATVRNARFTDTFFGPKQESTAATMHLSYGNVMEDCSFEVNNKFFIVGQPGYLLNISEGRADDTFTARRCNFTYSGNVYLSHVVKSNAANVLFDGCNFNINLTKQTDASSPYSALCIFASYVTTRTAPKFTFSNCNIVVNGRNYAKANAFAYLFGKFGTKSYSVAMDNCNVSGTARADYSLFENMSNVALSNCMLSIGGFDYHGYAINTPKALTVSNCLFNGTYGKYNTLVCVPKSASDYSAITITNTKVSPTVANLFTTAPAAKKVKVSNVTTNGTRQAFKSNGSKK